MKKITVSAEAVLAYAHYHRAGLFKGSLADFVKGKPVARGVDLRYANLAGADFTGVDFQDANFEGAKLSRATIPQNVNRPFTPPTAAAIELLERQAKENNPLLYHPRKYRAAITLSQLTPINFSQANLSGANLKQTNLTGAVFTKSNLYQAILRHAKLQGTSWDQAIVAACDFTHTEGLTRDSLLSAKQVERAIVNHSEDPNNTVLFAETLDRLQGTHHYLSGLLKGLEARLEQETEA